MRAFRPGALAILSLALTLAGCKARRDEGPVRVDVIGTIAQMRAPLDNGGNPAGQTMLAATMQGLVTFDARGQLTGALAERWIVEEDGASYLFRLRHLRWADGRMVRARDVAALLRARLQGNPALLAGLAPRIRAMTDEVLEIRLPAPVPSFLQLLAHPAIGIAQRGAGTGPYRVETQGDVLHLSAMADETAAEEAGEAGNRRALYLRALRPAMGFTRFARGDADLLLGGRFQHLPYVVLATLPGGTLRVDPVNGLLGLMVEGDGPLLADERIRGAMAMAIDRAALTQSPYLPGWRTATGVMPARLDLGRDPAQPAWAVRDMAARRAYARSVVADWASMHGLPPRLRIALPAGPGANLLFHQLRRDLAAIGLSVEQVAPGDAADLRLIDEVAPFDSALWYLARTGGKEAGAALDRARHAPTEAERAAALQEAEMQTLAHHHYIPLGMPIRFALVRPRLTGFQLSPRARHPLNALFNTPD